MKKISAIFLGLILTVSVFAQQKYDADATIMTIDGRKITKGEFERIYHKNNNSSDIKSVNDYVDLFVDFKLKVIDAENRGMDTLPKFKKELEGYVRQLEKPYLTDSAVDARLINEALERSKYDVRVSHILISVKKTATPQDTLKAYNKIKSIYNRIKKGESFETLAKKYSDDKYTAVKGGDLGYFTVFQMVYPFESAAYNTPVGKMSKIFRTRFGYHILKVTDKRPAYGEVKVAHIMLSVPKDADSTKKAEIKAKIDKIYKELKTGADFAELAKKYSDDKGSAKRGGELQWFGTGRMVPEFELAAFSLKHKGDFTKPIQTPYGWHIIKLLDKKAPKNLSENKEEVKSKLSKNNRAKQSYFAVLARIKKEYGYKENINELKKIMHFYDKNVLEPEVIELTDSIIDTYTNKLMTIGDSTYLVRDFMKFLKKAHSDMRRDNPAPYIYRKFQEFSEKKIFDYERKQLPIKYPEFKYLVKEYHDGILLFDLTDKMVWTKAIKDTAGLREFYEKHKNKYMWGERTHAYIFTVPERYAKKAKKIAKKSTGLTVKEITDKLYKLAKKDTSANFLVEEKKLSKGDNETIDKANPEKGSIVDLENKDGVVKFAYIIEKLPPMPKELSEIKGLMTADYQNYLEKEWVKDLRKKYTVKINQDVLKSVK